MSRERQARGNNGTRIVEALREGLFIEDAAAQAGVGKQTIDSWKERGEPFASLLASCERAEPEAVRTGGKGRRYGARQHTGEDDPFEPVIDMRGMTVEQLRALAWPPEKE